MKILKFGFGSLFVVLIILVVLWVFVVDMLVENMIETKGTEIIGAKVELDHADLTLFPSGLTLTRLQATNPEKPMTNAVEINRIAMSLDIIALLWRKVIVEEMAVEGVRFGTERQQSGAVLGLSPSDPPDKEFSMKLPALEVPDVQKILERENLETVKLIEALKADLQRERELWKTRLKELPGKAQFKNYKQRVKQIKKASKEGIRGILGGVEDIQTLQKEIKKDVAEVKGAQKEFKEKLALLKTRLTQIKTAPKRDVEQLKKKYNLSLQGLSNLSQALFGAKISSWVRQGTMWYERLTPYLEQGQDEVGDEPRSSSSEEGVDFLIRLANVSILLEAGQFSGTIHNITQAQATFGQPLTFTFRGETLKGIDAIRLNGSLDHRQPNQSSDRFEFQANGFQLQNITLSKNNQWPVSLASGMADMSLNAQLQGRSFNAKGSGILTNLDIATGSQENSNSLTRSLTQAVSKISSLKVNAAVTGTIDDYDIELRSDFDDILREAAGEMINEVSTRFSQKLHVAITAKTAEPIKSLRENLGTFGAVGGDLADRLSQSNGLLKDLLQQGVSKKILPKKLLPDGLKLPF